MTAIGSKKNLTILVHEWVTGGGLAGSPLPESLAAEGGAMRRSIANDFASVPGESVNVIVSLDARLPAEPGPWHLVSISEAKKSERIAQLAASADFTILIAPETSGVLASLTRELERAGARILGSTAEAIELTGNKARLADWIDSLGIDTPRTRKVDLRNGLPTDTLFPAVLKPIDGAGSADTILLVDAQSLPKKICTDGPWLLQPYVAGVPMSASFLVGVDHRARLIAIGRQNFVVHDRRFQYRGGSIPALRLDDAHDARKLVESINGLCGFVGVDFIWDAGRRHATILEINPRATTSHVGLSRLLPAGMLARAWLDACVPTGKQDHGNLDRLAEIIHQQVPFSFDATGTVVAMDEGALP